MFRHPPRTERSPAGREDPHRAVRERVGLFDLTHLGKVDVTGPVHLHVAEQPIDAAAPGVPAVRRALKE